MITSAIQHVWVRRRAFWSLVLITIVLTLLSRRSKAADDSLTVATFNINFGNVALGEIEKAIRQADADIVCLQETTRQSEQFLRRKFAGQYRHIRFVGYRGFYYAERFGFLSKIPLAKLKYDPPQHGLFGTYYTTISHAGIDIRIANVHLTPFVVRRGSNVRQAMAAINGTEVAHRDEIHQIVDNLDFTEPALVVGDFNSLATFYAPSELIRRGMTDSFADVTERPDAHPTWHWKLGQGEIQFRIDYVFHTNDFRTVSSRIIQSQGSDHYLLLSELKLAGTNQ